MNPIINKREKYGKKRDINVKQPTVREYGGILPLNDLQIAKTKREIQKEIYENLSCYTSYRVLKT